jgi:ketopantoate reductase
VQALVAGIYAEISDSIERMIWEKFVFLVGLSGTTSLFRTTIGPIREDPEKRAALLDVMREVVAVGRVKRVGLAADYAENRLAFCDTLLYVILVVPEWRRAFALLPAVARRHPRSHHPQCL